MLVVNLFSGPGAGKSTGAAYIFSQLKMKGINCELATEFVKDKVYEESKAVFQNQLYILGKQNFKLSRLKDKVDVVVTDSPILLGMIYMNNDERKNYGLEFDALSLSVFRSYDNFNVFLKREKPYQTEGRFQTEEEAKEIDNKVIDLLWKHDISYRQYTGNLLGYNLIVDDVCKVLKNRK